MSGGGADLTDETSPGGTLVLGPDSAGNMLELIVLHFDDGRDMVIHAMAMRRHYESLLPRQEPPASPPRRRQSSGPPAAHR